MSEANRTEVRRRKIVTAIEGRFRRLSRGKSENYRLPMAGFAVSHLHIKPKSDRRKVRRQWWRIQRRDTNRHVYRTLSFHPPLKTEKWVLTSEAAPEDNPEIILDWDGWVDLLEDDEEANESLDLSITLVRWWQFLSQARCLWRHPDPTHRLAGKVALISLFLGAVALVVTLLGAGAADADERTLGSPQDATRRIEAIYPADD